MPQVMLDLAADQIKEIIFQLPSQDFVALWDAIEERAETFAIMQLAETGFREWSEDGERIYDAEVEV